MTTAISPRTDYHQIAAHARWELDRLTENARRDVDAFAEWAEQQAEQAKAEAVELCNELGAPYYWAVLPEHPARQLSPASLARQATLDNLVRNNRPGGWVPPRRAAVLAGPAPDETLPGREATPQPMPALTPAVEGTYTMPVAVDVGPRNPIARRVDGLFARVEAWWRRKQAQRDQRMGV